VSVTLELLEPSGVSRMFKKVQEDSRRFQKIPEDSRRFKKIQEGPLVLSTHVNVQET